MTPATNPTSKRAADAVTLPGVALGQQSVMTKRCKKIKHAPVVQTLPRCFFLDMPPEIRNRIYYFCKETTFSDYEGAPCALRKRRNATPVPEHAKARTFFSLTQTCKLLRAEYQPVWLRGSSVSIDFSDLGNFISTFYPQRGDRHTWYRNSPQLLLILWDHKKSEAKENNLLLDLMPMLRLRAWCPSSTIKFASRMIAENEVLHAFCWDCRHCICGDCGRFRDFEYDDCYSNFDSFDSYNDNSEDNDEVEYENFCDHDDATDLEYGRLETHYSYLRPLNEFLANSNKTWLELIREDFQHCMTIECTMGDRNEASTIYFRFAWNMFPVMLQTERMYSSSCEFLTNVGIMDLPLHRELDFVTALPTGKYTRPYAGAYFTVPTLNQTHICGRTYKAPVVAGSEDTGLDN